VELYRPARPRTVPCRHPTPRGFPFMTHHGEATPPRHRPPRNPLRFFSPNPRPRLGRNISTGLSTAAGNIRLQTIRSNGTNGAGSGPRVTADHRQNSRVDLPTPISSSNVPPPHQSGRARWKRAADRETDHDPPVQPFGGSCLKGGAADHL